MLVSHINKKFLAIFVAFLLGVSTASADDCSKRAFDIQVDNIVTINEVLGQLSDICRFSTVAKDSMAAEELQKSINGINIKGKKLREVLNILLTENNLNYEFSNGVLKVSSLFTKTFRVDYITSVRQGTAITKSSTDSVARKTDDSADGNDERYSDNQISTTESFDFWSTISNEITLILNNGTEKYQAVAPIVNPNAGLVTVTATKSQIKRVQAYINDLQKRLKKQVMLDVSIIAVNLKDSYQSGIDWSQFSLGFGSYLPDTRTYTGASAGFNLPGGPANSFSKAISGGAWTIAGGLNFNINGMINFLQEKGKTKTISNPKILTLNNQPALISVGDNLNYILKSSTNSNESGTTTAETEDQYTMFVGLLLNILPEISDDNKIMLRINPSLSELKNVKDEVLEPGGRRNVAPDTKENKLSTVAYVNDGDTVILGGLIKQSKDRKNNRVPVLHAVPIIGNLFKSEKDELSVTELVFVITPRIVDLSSKRDISDSLKELGYSKSIYEY